MKIALVTIAYNLPGENYCLLASFYRSTQVHELSSKIFLHSTLPGVADMGERVQQDFPDVDVYAYGQNRGLSRSWNEGMLAAYDEGADLVLIANDDVEFTPGDVDTLVKASEAAGPDCFVVSACGFQRRNPGEMINHGFSCFSILPQAVERIGCFDENIFPIYFEDCDYYARGVRAGMHQRTCEDTKVLHGGSEAIRTDGVLNAQNALTFQRNKDYYVRKWGAEQAHEVYPHPFNNPVFTSYISPEHRHSPYGPPYDRTDQDIVKV